ncbi:MAG: hypothetical protein ACREIC_08465, partial [Limisphaerales bacterium]
MSSRCASNQSFKVISSAPPRGINGTGALAELFRGGAAWASDGWRDSAYKLISRHRIGYERQGCPRASDIVLH